jgi:hypothetical protein
MSYVIGKKTDDLNSSLAAASSVFAKGKRCIPKAIRTRTESATPEVKFIVLQISFINESFCCSVCATDKLGIKRTIKTNLKIISKNDITFCIAHNASTYAVAAFRTRPVHRYQALNEDKNFHATLNPAFEV